MTYFRCVSELLSVVLGLGALWLLAAPGHYKRLAIRFLPGKRPVWFVLSAALMTVWVVYTWGCFIEVRNIPSAAISMILSLTLIKGYFALFHYEAFRLFAAKFLALEDALLRTFAVFYLALAIALFAIGAG